MTPPSSRTRGASAPARRTLLVAGAAIAASGCWHVRAALAQTAAATAAAERSAPALPAVGSALKLAEAALLDGGRFNPADAEGQVLVLYWWASWCPFCAEQSPHMQALWEKGRPRGLRMLALSIDRRPEDALAYLKKNGYTFPAAMVTPEISRVLPKPSGLPVTLVRGRDGRVLQAERGQLFPEDVEALIRWLG
ncbi:MAG: TlpA family protein disulfide reductase [Burkholderiaceae bacterium]|nr:TlpA family protein disulfide reductase [Burkholderiaceae bacterium]